MQSLSIIGRLGDDAQIKDLNSNQVIEFSVAVSESYTDKQGTKQTKTTWFNCAKWGNQTAVAQYLKKGGQVFVSGKPNNRAYAKDDGTIVVVNGITVMEIELLGNKDDSTAKTQNKAVSQPTNSFVDTPKSNTQEVPNINNNEEHDDLPF
jgi:single-strand DNA-binding protein